MRWGWGGCYGQPVGFTAGGADRSCRSHSSCCPGESRSSSSVVWRRVFGTDRRVSQFVNSSIFLISACSLLSPRGGGGGSSGAASSVEGRAVALAAPQAVGVQLLPPSTESLSCASPCTASPLRRRPSCQSLSMSLYFLRRMETWSLNRTGSNLIWECTSGMPPNQLANLFMQVCR